MAYKFQLGDSRLSGSLVQEGDVDVADGGLKIAGTEIVTSARVLQNLSDVASIAGDGLANNSGVLDINVDDESIELNSDTLRIKANGIDDSHIDWGTGAGQVSTDDMPEGSSNLWYTDARVRAAISEDADVLTYDSGTGVLGVDATMLTSSIRGALSVTDAGGDGSMSYNSSTGVLTYTGPSASEVRAHLSAGDMLDFSGGEFAVVPTLFTASWDMALAARDTDNVAEGSSNLYFTNARARAAVSVTDAGGDGSLSYDSGTGVITYTGPSAAEVRAHLSAGDMLDFSGGEFSVVPAAFTASWDLAIAARDTDNLSEGSSNLYFTDARARNAISEAADLLEYNSGTGVMSVNSSMMTSSIRGALSVTDAGGDGSLAYDSSTGVITYTGPSASEVRAHLSAGDMLDFSGGEFSVVPSAFTASWDLAIAARDSDNLSEGSSNLYFTDARARAAISVTDAGGDGSLSYNSGTGVITYTGPSASEVRAHLSAGDMLDFSGGEFAVVPTLFTASWDMALAARDTDNVVEGSSNLYFTDARARAAISVTDAGGDGSLAYNSGTGVITYTGPSAAEVRAHLSVTDTDTIDMTYSGGDFQAALRFDPTSFKADSLGGLQLSGAVAGAGMGLSAGVLSVNVDDSSIEINSDTLRVKAAGITDAMMNDDVATGLAGNGLSAASGIMALDLNELSAGTVAVAADSIAIIDADDGSSKKESIADLVTAMAGAGLTATNGVLAVDSAVAPVAIGDANGNLVEGFNFGNASLTAARVWTMPAPGEAGDIVHVKAPANCSSTLTITIDGATIDGESSIILESPNAAVSLICVDAGSDLWKLY